MRAGLDKPAVIAMPCSATALTGDFSGSWPVAGESTPRPLERLDPLTEVGPGFFG